MKFTLNADGAQSLGQGIGNMFKAYAMAPHLRQQAEQDAALKGAQIYHHNMSGNKSGTEAEGLRLTNTARTGPIDSNLPAALQTAYKLFQATGDTNMERFANAGTAIQTQGIRDQAVANVNNLDTMNRLNTLAKPGDTYMPFDAIGTTGYSVNKATGQGEQLDVLRKLFGEKTAADVARDRGAANASNASAGKYTAEADIERQKADRLRTTGSLPGTGAEGSEGALSSTILNTLKVPALDAKGRPVRNPITGELETVVDLDAQKSFYQWADQNKRKPTATAFSQWEAQGRPGANKNPPPAAAQPTIVQAPPAQERKPNTVYQTPKGPMKWTGTGWLPAN
jgi:hypothetical protein